MAYNEIYQHYCRQITTDIEKYCEKGKKFVIGYTSDLDVVISWDSNAFKNIIDEFLKSDPSLKDGDVIDSMESFARIVSYYMINGRGGEVDITDISVCEYLEEKFKTEFALGGTCAQGAAAINAVGFPVLVHITDRSKEVCAHMDGEGVETVTENGLEPIMKSATNEPPVRHMILQYPKGEKIKIGDKVYETPVSNRLIMDYDKIHKIMPVDKNFLDYCEKNAENILVYSISGFNGIIDEAIMRQRIDEVTEHYRRVKAKNADCIIIFEGAHYLNADLKNMVFDRLAGCIDICGMNEEELVEHTSRHGVKTDKEDIFSILEGLEYMIKKYPTKGIVLHTKDYSMYYGEKLNADIEKGLTLGNLMSATRARTGRYGSLEDCVESLNIPLSTVGMEFAEKLRDKKTEKTVYIVPSRYMEHPKYTIGLGDTFIAGFLTSFVR